MKLNRKCLCIAAMLVMIMTSGVSVCADSIQSTAQIPESSVSPRRDETEWVFRINPDTGVFEKRLWSITYGVWRTEWEPVGVQN